MAAERSEHFGHCDVFTVVTVNNGAVDSVETKEQVEHGPGGCMVPVQTLKDFGANAIVVGGIGARPLAGFAEVGIEVYFAPREQIRTVEEVVAAFLAGNLPIMQPGQSCKGGGDCHH
jgi:predicted Fe-Mo cluster-binding NifX family protein